MRLPTILLLTLFGAAGSIARAQAPTWTPFFLFTGSYFYEFGEPITAAQAGYSEYSTSWPILGTAPPGTSAAPPTWVGAITSTPNNLGPVVATATDGAGDIYTLYAYNGTPSGKYESYISKTTPDNTTVYFGYDWIGSFGGLWASPSGLVFVWFYPESSIYLVNPDGTTTVAFQLPNGPQSALDISVDANGDITINGINYSYGSNSGAAFPTLTEVSAITGTVPYFPEGITMPPENGDGYPPGVFPMVPYPPSTPTYAVPFSSTPTIALSISDATSTLPVTYQWYYEGAAISNATFTTYNGPFLGNGTYSVTASTTGGTVTASATLTLTVNGTPVTAAPVFLSSPANLSTDLGSPITLSASAGSTLPVTFQWFFNGTAIPGANTGQPSPTTDGLYSTSYATDQPGVYTVVATTTGSGGASLASPAATLTVTTTGGVTVQQVPSITTEPQSISFDYGSLPNLSVSALASLPITYQWQINGAAIPGATQSSYSTGIPGSYTVVVTTTAGSVTSSPAVVALASRPINISTRALVGTGAGTCIAGFVVSSYSGSAKQLLVRAVGPTLTEFNVPGVLAQPILTIIDSTGKTVASNTGWNNSAAIAAAAVAVGAFALPAGSADSALLVNLPPGSYTAQVTGLGGTTGVALVEVYEVVPDAGHLINMSTRSFVGTGSDILIGGFVVAGTQPSQLLIRGVGPALAQFGVSGALPQPVLSVYDSAGNLIAANVGWSDGSSEDAVAVANAETASGAFPLTAGSADSAVFVTLSPGQYTVQVTGVNGTTGIALVEVYEVP